MKKNLTFEVIILSVWIIVKKKKNRYEYLTTVDKDELNFNFKIAAKIKL